MIMRTLGWLTLYRCGCGRVRFWRFTAAAGWMLWLVALVEHLR